MTSTQHGSPTNVEFLCVFTVLYRSEKNAKKISIIEKKGLVTSVKISLCVAPSYSRLWKDRRTVTPRKMGPYEAIQTITGHKKKRRKNNFKEE